MPLAISSPTQSDAPAIWQLYQAASTDPAGLIRRPAEITLRYVEEFLEKSLHRGLVLVALHDGEIAGEIHAYTPELEAFRHLLSELTIVVHPKHQGMGIGRQLFEAFLAQVRLRYPHVLRVELYVRETNIRNVAFYESLGFVNEGRQEHKIYGPSGNWETPLHMAWFNPDFSQQKIPILTPPSVS